MKSRALFRVGKALRSLLFGGTGLGGMALIAFTLSARAAIFDVDVSGYTLYTDPTYKELQIKLGGFSGLYPVPGDMTGTMFYTVTDRGPTQDFTVTNNPTGTNIVITTHKVLPCHAMAPMIVKVQLLAGGTAQVLQIIPLRKEVSPGVFTPISGLPNGVEQSPEKMEDPYYHKLANDPDGLDPEGITMDDNGFFWICDEYRPSIAMVAPDGTVLLRLVPKGCLLGTEKIPTYDILPAVLVKRVNNRGMEGITYTRNGCLYAVVQRPLANPTKAVSEASSNIRIVEVNLKAFLNGGTQAKVRQFIYRGDSASAKVYASDIFALNPAIMLVPERATDKLYAINISSATDITPFETEDGELIADPTTTIEQLDEADLAALRIRTVKKAAILPSMIALHKELAKCEGVAVVGGTVVLTYDNDFNLGDFGGGPTTPGVIGLKSPDVYPALITALLPEEFFFGK
jgi:hypothetical protein